MGTTWADERRRWGSPAPRASSRSATLVRPADDHRRRFRVVVLVQDEVGTVAVGETEVQAEDQLGALRTVRDAGGVAADANPSLLIGR